VPFAQSVGKIRHSTATAEGSDETLVKRKEKNHRLLGLQGSFVRPQSGHASTSLFSSRGRTQGEDWGKKKEYPHAERGGEDSLRRSRKIGNKNAGSEGGKAGS